MGVIAVGGGKGGVGRSLVASGVAVFLAQLGRRVVLVDGHPGAPQLARGFGVSRSDPEASPWSVRTRDPRGEETVVPNLRVLTATGELGAVAGLTLRRPDDLARSAGADACVVDLGAGLHATTLEAMLAADAAVLVTTPEPVAVEAVYRWIRHAFARSLSSALRTYPAAVKSLDEAVRSQGGAPAPRHLAEIVATGTEADVAALAWSTLGAFRIRLVVNMSRSRGDLDLGDSMAVVAQQRLGIALEYLGHVEYDDAVVLAARRSRPLLVDAPQAKAARNLERIARRLAGVESGRTPVAIALTEAPEAPTHYETLVVDRGASDEEIRRAYRRLRDMHGSDSVAVSGLFTESERERAVVRVEEARDVLLDPARRRPYDLSISRPEDSIPPPGMQDEPVVVPPEAPAVLLARITPDTEFSGALLKEIREAYGVDLKDVAARTKITLTSLRAIEDEAYQQLPATVYLRGFVAEVAKFFRLDVEQVTRTYLRRHRRATEAAPARNRG